MHLEHQNSFIHDDLVTLPSANAAYRQFGHGFGNSQGGYNSGGRGNFRSRGHDSNHSGPNGSDRGNRPVCQLCGKPSFDTKLIKSKTETFETDL
ncbi:hypothetical protein TorRG33x02_051970 [Trema orientale]|uniref:Uncharacterized protein n=1 Tax=Trema orientale TaxID=63057 RepID=A0A2P5FMF9_TREOI|nr:hypothetical protein TorRG33x02_051970 [Trema orientale]